MSFTWIEARDGGRYAERLFINLPASHGDVDPSEPQLREVILWHIDGVGVMGDYHDAEPLRVTPLDLDGDCLLRVPASMIERVYTEAEAECIERCYDADTRLLSYARG
jgi:hypothetical protein